MDFDAYATIIQSPQQVLALLLPIPTETKERAMPTSYDAKPFDHSVALYQAYQEYRNLSPRTVQTSRDRLQRYATWMTAKVGIMLQLRHFTPESVQQYVAALRSKKKWDDSPCVPKKDAPLSSVTIQDHVRTLKAFSTWLSENDYTIRNMLGKLPLPDARKPVLEPLTAEEIKRLLGCFNTKTKLGARNYTICLLFLDAGLRASELAGLTVDTVHLGRDQGWVKVLGKGDKERIVYLGRQCQYTMLHYKTIIRSQDAACESFFIDQYGQPLTVHGIQQVLKGARERSGITRLHAHLLRHTMATNYLAEGGDAVSLRDKLGHTTLDMTSNYVHFAEQQRAGIQRRVSPMDKMRLPPMKGRASQGLREKAMDAEDNLR